MSYCRFQNTANDLEDCINAIENGEIHELSVYEIQGIKSLLELSETVFYLKDEIEEGIMNSENAMMQNK
tara:strand:+ start:1888 stop:2094 length:207 start_codon:yes stop_codon:yes gene_type:complete